MSDLEGMSEDYVDGYKDAEAAYKKRIAELEAENKNTIKQLETRVEELTLGIKFAKCHTTHKEIWKALNKLVSLSQPPEVDEDK